jgi:hypothetical protein
LEAENLVMKNNKKAKIYKQYKYLGITLNREGIDNQKINNRITRRIIASLTGIL